MNPQGLEGVRATFRRKPDSIADRRSQVTALGLTVAAHLVLAGLILGIYAGPLTAPQSSLTFVMLKDEKPKPVPLMPVPRLISPQRITVPIPMFSTAPENGDGLKLVGGPVAYALSDPTYLAQIRAHLARYTIYPPEAATRHLEGVVYLQFISDAAGNVLFSRIGKSSGSALLDAQALALIQKAQPLPPIPPSLHMERVYLLIPITFKPPL